MPSPVLAFTMNFADGANGTCYLKDGLEITPHAGNCDSGGVIPTVLPPPPPPGPAPTGAMNVLMILIDDPARVWRIRIACAHA